MSIPILAYHQIDVVPPKGTPLRGLVVSPYQFRRQMTWMKRLGYRVLFMRELMPYLRGEVCGRVFGITFDDGFSNVLRNAMPVLGDCGFTATTYFVSGQIGGSNIWDMGTVSAAPLMDHNEIRAWAAAGHEVGAHTIDHVHLPALPDTEARRQIASCRSALEEIISMPVTAFCFPYGEQLAIHRDMVRQAGYENATTTSRGLASAWDDRFGLSRVSVHCGTNLFRFLHTCLTKHEDRRSGGSRISLIGAPRQACLAKGTGLVKPATESYPWTSTLGSSSGCMSVGTG